MKLPFNLRLDRLCIKAEAMHHARRVAWHFALQETGAALCACAPYVYHAGETLQRLGRPTAPDTTFRPSTSARPAPFEEPSSFDF